MAHTNLLKLLFKTTVYTLLCVLFLLLMTAVIAGWWGYTKLTTFTQSTNTTPAELVSLAQTALETTPKNTNGITTFLVLGIDAIEERDTQSLLTDTILLVSIDLATAQVRQLSLPRDIWIPEYKTKINALYHYGSQQNPEQPTALATQAVSTLTGMDIHHTVVLTLADLSQVVDALGGVTVTVAEGFTDERFPTQDLENPYQTITFSEGEQQLSAEQALQFIRSRNAQGDQGTDIARAARQQLVLKALIESLQKPEIITNPEILAALYTQYEKTFEPQLPLLELMAIANTLRVSGKQPELVSVQLPIYPEDPDGVIWHPPVRQYGGQWVYAIRDQEQFARTVQKALTQQHD